MVMVPHQTEGVEQPVLLPHFLGEEIDEDQVVVFVFEDGLLAVASCRNVIASTREFESQSPSHQGKIHVSSYKYRLDPNGLFLTPKACSKRQREPKNKP
jgi:hypothetical protein